MFLIRQEIKQLFILNTPQEVKKSVLAYELGRHFLETQKFTEAKPTVFVTKTPPPFMSDGEKRATFPDVRSRGVPILGV